MYWIFSSENDPLILCSSSITDINPRRIVPIVLLSDYYIIEIDEVIFFILGIAPRMLLCSTQYLDRHWQNAE